MSTAAPVEDKTKAIAVKQNIPIQLTDLTVFDDTYAFMKERFLEEMKRVDSQMNHLSSAMSKFYNQKLSVQTGLTSQSTAQGTDWESIANSPLVEIEGEEKLLKLQFDLSQFEPEEVTVLVANNLLTVSALHAEKNDKINIYREYNREFQLPVGTNPDKVISSMSRDGILTVKAPLLSPKELVENRPQGLHIAN